MYVSYEDTFKERETATLVFSQIDIAKQEFLSIMGKIYTQKQRAPSTCKLCWGD